VCHPRLDYSILARQSTEIALREGRQRFFPSVIDLGQKAVPWVGSPRTSPLPFLLLLTLIFHFFLPFLPYYFLLFEPSMVLERIGVNWNEENPWIGIGVCVGGGACPEMGEQDQIGVV